ncbi:23S rRNA (adenine(1618)-N(6))-methyltransferase RlmF [Aliarcobacter cibarius]|jgi:23S rRNA (adenine1618-N6)-methyltransferase|uniref:23S rRNA mA1618 methyltransferase n=1 Tax=Aliarcobacter cibarius TaxID=255507 RepID=A0A5J6RIS2_9BACT|nr:23S rRNA (adenine(1618)-N(6))-methyltransferase RlmF [Aliarcobacter cibarius]QEZ89287.1 23S rRNA mA1618 methyltransferase [Aliarcobacter cibarius]QKJ27320.1 23S rRNA mA1618 methyltransferase [Aliarcobacter cibarius]TLT02986.1 23S rRNA (adenine(1618)-N(6))-methyltransferase RlmF [Aliarcobacter cibarius]
MSTTKTLHPRNFHNDRYDFSTLIKSQNDLKEFVKPNKYGDLSIDFANSNAVIALNKALLSHFYGIKNWEIPKGYLCPPIPGRADYIHHIADLLASCNDEKVPRGKTIKGLDVGIGANCIYPIIGVSVYGWKFLGSDIEKVSIQSVQNIINSNEILKENIIVKQQENSSNIFVNIINKDEKYDFTLCNPPFHKSLDEALAGNKRKVQNLTKQKNTKSALNFGGKNNELWCEGGEIAFIKNMIKESLKFPKNCLWFTTLVSKKENLPFIYKSLKDIKAVEVKTIEMAHGQKISRIVAWTFLSKDEQKTWAKNWVS